jgi:hypothetical protein
MRAPEPKRSQRAPEDAAYIERAPEPERSRRVREVAAIEQIVDLIRSRIVPAGDDRIDKREAFTTRFWVQYRVAYLQQMFELNENKSPWGIVRENEKLLNEGSEIIQALLCWLDKLPDELLYLIYSNKMPGLMSLKFRATMAREHPKTVARFQDYTVKSQVIEDRCRN